MNAVLVLGLMGLLCLGLLQGAAQRISHWLSNGELSRHITLLGVYLLWTLVSAGFEIVMIARKRHLPASLCYAFSDTVRAMFFVIPALLTRSLEWVLLGGVIFAMARLGVALLYFAREFRTQLKPDVSLLKEQLGYALPFASAVLLETLQANYHQYAVSYAFDAATFAIYSVGCLQIPLVDFLGTPAGSVMMVRMSENLRDGRSGTLLPLWHDTTRKLALVFFPLLAWLLASARDIMVFLFTERYSAGVPIFLVWSTMVLFSALQTDAVLRVFAATRFLLVLNVIRLVLIAALMKQFLSSFHLLGAVFVPIVATLVAKALALVKIRSLLRCNFSRLLPWRSLASILVAAAAAGVISLGVRSVLHLSTPARIVAVGLVYAVTYLALLLRFSLLSAGERLAITGLLQRYMSKGAKEEEIETI